jgi:tricorn protease-like protein
MSWFCPPFCWRASNIYLVFSHTTLIPGIQNCLFSLWYFTSRSYGRPERLVHTGLEFRQVFGHKSDSIVLPHNTDVRTRYSQQVKTSSLQWSFLNNNLYLSQASSLVYVDGKGFLPLNTHKPVFMQHFLYKYKTFNNTDIKNYSSVD